LTRTSRNLRGRYVHVDERLANHSEDAPHGSTVFFLARAVQGVRCPITTEAGDGTDHIERREVVVAVPELLPESVQLIVAKFHALNDGSARKT